MGLMITLLVVAIVAVLALLPGKGKNEALLEYCAAECAGRKAYERNNGYCFDR